MAKPRSLHKLDGHSASLLREYFQTAKRGLGVTKLNHLCLIILWLMDESGTIWFALEEAYSADHSGSHIHHPVSRVWSLPSKYLKLGHPALLSGDPKKARIGGEIVYDPDFGEHEWVISNKSGRFGPNSKKQPREHLEKAAEVWKQFGIDLDVHYLKPAD
ncbi:hypothetical protein [Rhizobium sp. R635]|uniref:hypothetical protein n=1 Tax=Rhizobium sp. R635 TaxID=1764275 RepID=UPI00113258EE|nr:hypothetical protein [Rhizobium sp. R635]